MREEVAAAAEEDDESDDVDALQVLLRSKGEQERVADPSGTNLFSPCALLRVATLKTRLR